MGDAAVSGAVRAGLGQSHDPNTEFLSQSAHTMLKIVAVFDELAIAKERSFRLVARFVATLLSCDFARRKPLGLTEHLTCHVRAGITLSFARRFALGIATIFRHDARAMIGALRRTTGAATGLALPHGFLARDFSLAVLAAARSAPLLAVPLAIEVYRAQRAVDVAILVTIGAAV